MHRDKDYVVKDDQVLIVDEFTGRIMPGRRYSDGLHQAIEAKEHVKVKRESKTLATITFQNFFNKFEKKSGMTGKMCIRDRGALERTVAYVKERKQFGRAIGAFQNTQFQLADMATKVEAAQLLVYKAAMAKATQKTYSVEAAKAKLYAAEVAMEVTTKAVQLHGGYGYTREYEVERMMRDAKTVSYTHLDVYKRQVSTMHPVKLKYQ